jgi:ABC-type multidrug transport system ATPase subunit
MLAETAECHRAQGHRAAIETIDLLARMRGGLDAERRAELIERFELDPRKKARTYSKCNR